MTIAKFKVFSGGGKYNGASEATVTIDRNNNLVQVRPKRRRKQYEMRLEDLAEIVIWNCIKAEMNEKKKAKLAKRKGLFGR